MGRWHFVNMKPRQRAHNINHNINVLSYSHPHIQCFLLDFWSNLIFYRCSRKEWPLCLQYGKKIVSQTERFFSPKISYAARALIRVSAHSLHQSWAFIYIYINEASWIYTWIHIWILSTDEDLKPKHELLQNTNYCGGYIGLERIFVWLVNSLDCWRQKGGSVGWWSQGSWFNSQIW